MVGKYPGDDLNIETNFKQIFQLALCEEHFTADQFMNPNEKGVFKSRKQLRKDAVPTLFDISNPQRLVVERRSPKRRLLSEDSTDSASVAKKLKGAL